uniref:Uncharacterized protein n=1 Tax=Vitis vinifera TaxID=29760 RepID=F6GT95_VITVI
MGDFLECSIKILRGLVVKKVKVEKMRKQRWMDGLG